MGGLHYFGQLNGGITANYGQTKINKKPAELLGDVTVLPIK